MRKAIWITRRIDHQTIRYALRAGAKGKGHELGAYSSWDNPRAEEASEPYALRIERKAREAGYEILAQDLND